MMLLSITETWLLLLLCLCILLTAQFIREQCKVYCWNWMIRFRNSQPLPALMHFALLKRLKIQWRDMQCDKLFYAKHILQDSHTKPAFDAILGVNTYYYLVMLSFVYSNSWGTSQSKWGVGEGKEIGKRNYYPSSIGR